ncbi:efflux RND transporter periplasmic adaptor subunit [Aureivirga sp. CE67]|uniref:efflux RND transporter periplasmic adaptor subunit n=1 Tax=Aureivirga sp. CE67 TaxID=1788983 RepID=UPI001E2E436A|nr:efflux RND transporter periplasmic adaptor subunit [Aureivirga sp. CE67]
MKKSIFIILLGLIFTFTSCGNDEKVQTEQRVRPVKFTEIGFIGGERTRTFDGVARNNKEVNLSFRISGIITYYNLKSGQKVKKGELLAKLDNAETTLAYEQAVASLNSSKSALNTAKSTLDRTRTLYEKGTTSLSEYENAKNGYASAKANYQSALRSVDIQKKQISYASIYAPFDGTIISEEAEKDETVSAGKLIAVLNAGGDMEVRLGIPENVINKMQMNMEVSISFPSLEGLVFNGVVSQITPAIDQNTSTYPIKVKILDPVKDIKSGMVAKVTFDFETNTDRNVLVVPINAVGKDGQGNFVFLIKSDDDKTGIAEKKYIQIGELTAEGFEIKSGLKLGDKIATAGLQTLLNGQKVLLD